MAVYGLSQDLQVVNPRCEYKTDSLGIEFYCKINYQR